MRIQGCTVRPLFYEHEVPRVFLVDVKIIRHTQWFLFGSRYKFSVKRHDVIDMFQGNRTVMS